MIVVAAAITGVAMGWLASWKGINRTVRRVAGGVFAVLASVLATMQPLACSALVLGCIAAVLVAYVWPVAGTRAAPPSPDHYGGM